MSHNSIEASQRVLRVSSVAYFEVEIKPLMTFCMSIAKVPRCSKAPSTRD